MRTPEEKKAAQARAHKKWRESEKGKTWRKNYYEKNHKKPQVNEPTS